VRVGVAEGIGKKVAVVVNIEKMKATAVAGTQLNTPAVADIERTAVACPTKNNLVGCTGIGLAVHNLGTEQGFVVVLRGEFRTVGSRAGVDSWALACVLRTGDMPGLERKC
jgi:hypothetical protein